MRPAGATERQGRPVGHNPISWRESVARGQTPAAIIGRWGFVAVGILIALVVLTLYHTGMLTHATLRLTIASVLCAEIVIITLVALNMSATAVSREREDGTLDIILTTPIQPGPYIRGKHRGLFQFLMPMILVPTVTLGLAAVYVALGGFGRTNGTVLLNVQLSQMAGTIDRLPVLLPEGAIALPLMLAPFIAFCVMVGLQWSIKSKGTIGSVIAAVAVVFAVVGVLSLCGVPAGKNLSVLGAMMSAFSPINLLFAVVYPAETIPSALESGMTGARTSILVGAAVSAVAYAAISYGMHTTMKRTFMMTVRRLAGTT